MQGIADFAQEHLVLPSFIFASIIVPTIFLACAGRKAVNLSLGSMGAILMTSVDLSTDVLFCAQAFDEGGFAFAFAVASLASLVVSLGASAVIILYALRRAMQLERAEDHQLNVRSLLVRVAALQLELQEEVRLLVGAAEGAPEPPHEALGWSERRLKQHYEQHAELEAQADAAPAGTDTPRPRLGESRPAPGISRHSILDVAAVQAHGSYHVSLVLLSATNLELLKLMPWRSTLYDGFPSTRLMFLSQASLLLEDIPQLLIQLSYLAVVGAAKADGSLAVPVLSIVFTAGTMLHRGLTKTINFAAARSAKAARRAEAVSHLSLVSSQRDTGKLLGSARGRRSDHSFSVELRQLQVEAKVRVLADETIDEEHVIIPPVHRHGGGREGAPARVRCASTAL